MANQPVSYRWNPYDRANHVVIEVPSSPPPPVAPQPLPVWQLPTPPTVSFYDEPSSRRWSTFESIPIVVQPYYPENEESRRPSFVDLRLSHGSSTVAAPFRASFIDHGAICREPSNSSFAGLSSQPSAVSTSLATTVSSHSGVQWRPFPAPTPVAPQPRERFEPSHATFAPRPSPSFMPVPPAPIAPAVLSSLKRFPFFCDLESRQHSHSQPPAPAALKPERPMGPRPSSSSGSSRHSSGSAPRRYVFETPLAPQPGVGPACAPQRAAARVSPTPEESSSTTSLDGARFKSTGYARRQRRLKLKAAMAQRRLAGETAPSTEPAES